MRKNYWLVSGGVAVLSIGLISQWRGRQVEPVAESDAPRVMRSRTVQITTPLEELKQAPAEIRLGAPLRLPNLKRLTMPIFPRR